MIDERKDRDEAVEKELAGVPEQFLDDGEDEGDSVGDALELLRAELEAAKQEVLYAKAETQNVRRRMEKDMADARAYAATGFARDILSIADNLARAIEAVPRNCAKTRSSRAWSPGSRRPSAKWTRRSASTASAASPRSACRSIPTSIRR